MAEIHVRSIRGGRVVIDVRPGAKVHQVAADAAELLGYAPDVLYTLSEGEIILPWEDDCPTFGWYELVDTGEAV